MTHTVLTHTHTNAHAHTCVYAPHCRSLLHDNAIIKHTHRDAQRVNGLAAHAAPNLLGPDEDDTRDRLGSHDSCRAD